MHDLDGLEFVAPGYTTEAAWLRTWQPFKPRRQDWQQISELHKCPVLHNQAIDHAINIQRLRQVWQERQQPPYAQWDAVLQEHIQRGMRPQDEFRAGDLHNMMPVWEEYMRLGQIDMTSIEIERGILRDGIRLDWCHPTDAHKLQEPRHRKRATGVKTQLLRAGYTTDVTAQVLESDTIPPIALPNMLDDAEAVKFARQQVEKNVACGALIQWPFQDTRPHIVLSLAVVRKSDGKPRLIVDGRPLNLHLRRLPFKYETASDAVHLLMGNEWAWTLDVKAGYHHIMLHPDEWAYEGVQLDRTFYVHAALPFGLSQAPERFTRIMQLGVRPLVATGGAITGMVDDSLGAAKTPATAARDMGTQVEILGLLGWTMNNKSMSRPGRTVEYVGFEYQIDRRVITLPEKKLARIVTGLQEVRAGGTHRQYRRVVGQLAAAALAFPFSPLMIRALTLERDRDEETEAANERALNDNLTEFLLQDVRKIVGRPWDAPIRAATTLVVDTSESATGAHIPGTGWKASIPLQPDELRRRGLNDLSSTEAEAIGILRALQEGIRAQVVLTDGTGAVQVVCDNKGAVSALNHMRGSRKVFRAVAQIHLLAKTHRLVLTFEWRRRNTTEVVIADKYSKLQDIHDWRLSRGILMTQVRLQAPSWVRDEYFPPDIDMMASSKAHQVPNYVAGFWDGRCVAQNAMVQRWNTWPAGMTAKAGRDRPCIFLFPPTALLPHVIMKIEQEQPTAWLVCSRYLRKIEERQINKWPVKTRFPLQCREIAQVVKPTEYNPAKRSGERWRTPLQIIFVTWSS